MLLKLSIGRSPAGALAIGLPCFLATIYVAACHSNGASAPATRLESAIGAPAAADAGSSGAAVGSSSPATAPAVTPMPLGEPANASRVRLSDWSIQSSAVAKEGGAAISTPSYTPSGWYPTKVPSTVLASLVANGVYPDVLSGMNLRSVPGTQYPVGTDFLSTPIPPKSPFAPGWWFRTQFPTPAGSRAGSKVTLHFEGISYRANIFLNGQPIAKSSDVAGTFRRYDFDVTNYLTSGENALAVQVTAQAPTDLGLDFIDWNPAPADRYMGLIREVYLVKHGGVEIRDPYVATHLEGGNAALTVGAELHNGSPAAVHGTLNGTIEAVKFSKEVTLQPGETTSIAFDPSTFSQLVVSSPRLWWPAKLGPQELYALDLQFVVGGEVTHEQKIPFGIREVTSTVAPGGGRLFAINGKRILIRGAGYTPDILYRQDAARQLSELKYVLDLNLNTIRLEGKLEDENFLYMTDQLGILVMAGLMCCDYWQESAKWVPNDFTVAAASVHDQAMRLRKHPSVFTFLYGSDDAPVAQAEQRYLQALQTAGWPNPMQAAASEVDPPPATGPTGYKMKGPYDYVPPIYWYTDKNYGGAFGFASEISPGADVPPIESLRAMMGPKHLWPIDGVWNYHAGARGVFTNIDNFTNALNKRYGAASGAEDYANKSQLMAYESLRAMFEAYGRNKYASATGVIQWMLNNAWPGLIWHLYDYYLRPGGAYFGAKKGNEYLHVQYSYDDQSVVVVNHRYEPKSGLKATATLYDVHSAKLFTQSATLDVAEDSSAKTGIVVPTAGQASPVCFLQLDLTDAAGVPVSSNFYWLTPKPDVMGVPGEKSAWYFQPIASYADFKPLATMPQVALVASKTTRHDAGDSTTTVTLRNTSSAIAFFTRVQVVRSSGEEVLPILWDDDYVSIPPGESRTVSGTYATALAGAGEPKVKVTGQNVAASEL